MAEQRPFKASVEGSSPPRVTANRRHTSPPIFVFSVSNLTNCQPQSGAGELHDHGVLFCANLSGDELRPGAQPRMREEIFPGALCRADA